MEDLNSTLNLLRRHPEAAKWLQQLLAVCGTSQKIDHGDCHPMLEINSTDQQRVEQWIAAHQPPSPIKPEVDLVVCGQKCLVMLDIDCTALPTAAMVLV